MFLAPPFPEGERFPTPAELAAGIPPHTHLSDAMDIDNLTTEQSLRVVDFWQGKALPFRDVSDARQWLRDNSHIWRAEP